MSHFSVAVFVDGKNYTDDFFIEREVERLLEPFDENKSVPHYISKEELTNRAKERIEAFKNGTYARYLKDPEKYIEENKNSHAHLEYIKNFPKRLELTDEELYLEEIQNYDKEDLRPDGTIYSTYNPNSRWDWWQYGGRFASEIPLNDGSFADEAFMEDVNIDYVDKELYEESLEFWRRYIVEKEEDLSFYTREYYERMYDSAEDFAKERAGFTFCSAILPNGEWLSAGRIGMFCSTDATDEDEKAWRKQKDEILKKAKENNWHITIVDCHI